MQISQLKPGDSVIEHRDCGLVINYEVVDIKPVGKMFEVTFRSDEGVSSALYPASAFVHAAA
ncbi:hypothetical protein [Paludibacterium paludis]|uniref:Uncharacterized protein n=1 Tax=Paludibacterium paludis TaxID=1225769 RepID=A0A918U7N2_9NEIS|nr:hypothetical protein [Paludibacterium paludis]GGY03987.1 hypothetical protein GCM10011289_02960 [Paludibacterium paludis]